MNILNEGKQEAKLKNNDLSREIKELMSKIDYLEGEKEDFRKSSN
jgi:predicted  nucleic acid-binding Zn-ribbon protein